MGQCLSVIHTSSIAVIKPLEGLFSRELLWLLIYSNNLFSFTSLCLLWSENINSLSSSHPQIGKIGWLWVNRNYSFSFVLKNCSEILHHTLHINAQLCLATSLVHDSPSQPGENDTALNVSLWMERDFSPMQYVRDHDVVNLFKCKPVQFNYQSIIKFAATTPVLTTAVHTGWWHSRSGNWQTKSI